MSLAGHLSEYSLAEIFHFVQDGNKMVYYRSNRTSEHPNLSKIPTISHSKMGGSCPSLMVRDWAIAGCSN